MVKTNQSIGRASYESPSYHIALAQTSHILAASYGENGLTNITNEDVVDQTSDWVI